MWRLYAKNDCGRECVINMKTRWFIFVIRYKISLVYKIVAGEDYEDAVKNLQNYTSEYNWGKESFIIKCFECTEHPKEI